MEGDKERGIRDNENYGKTSTKCLSLCLLRNHKVENIYQLFKLFFSSMQNLIKNNCLPSNRVCYDKHNGRRS